MFQKGNKLAGSRKGIPNKGTAFKLKVIEHASKQNLEELRTTYPALFWKLVGQCLPKDVELSGGENGSPIQFVIRGISDKGNTNTSIEELSG